jgi:hypothetical protein
MANNINWGKIYGSTWWGNVTNTISWGKSYSSLAGTITTLASRFKERVLALGGFVESEECIDESVDASLYLKPTAFGNTKLFAALPEDGSGDMDFSRITSATNFDATRVEGDGDIQQVDENIPRIDYTDGGCPSLLLEPQSTNLVQYSEDFSMWGQSGVLTLTSGQLAPDGTLGATKISGTIGSSYMSLSQASSLTSTRTIYARTVSGTGTVRLMSHNSNTNNLFTLTEKWQRFEVNGTTSTSGQTSFYIDFRNNSQTLNEFIIWGAQSEELPYATSYIPNYGTLNGVTRSAETLTLDTTSLGLTTITETFADDSTNVITPVPSLYTASQGRIKQIIGE